MAILLSVCCLMGIEGQDRMYVNEKSGAKTLFLLSDINKLTFNSGNMNVNNKNGTTNNFAFNNIQNMNFFIYTAVVDISNTNEVVTIYPNPAKDRIFLNYNINATKKIQVQIMDIQGKVVFQQILNSQAGANYMTISVATLQHGMYLCQLRMDAKIVTTKFLKD
jgi:hypothetical protein